MNKSTIKALYFDLDHTLWDFEKNSALAFKTLFKSMLNDSKAFKRPLKGLEKAFESSSRAF